MTASGTAASLAGGVALLERALGYTLGSLLEVRPEALANSTPCAAWDLSGLLDHMNDSLAALDEAVMDRRVGLVPAARVEEHPVAAVTALRRRGCRLLGDWNVARGEDVTLSIGGRPVSTSLVAATGAVEVAVHGWDVARACDLPRRIPDGLGEELLEVAPLIVSEADRGTRFAAAVDVPCSAAPGDRLVAFLGRTPGGGP